MANAHGSKAVFKLDDAGGTLRDISAYIDSAELARTFESAETTGSGGVAAKTFILGPYGSKIPLKGTWDDTATTGSSTVIGGVADAGGQLTAGGSLSFEFSPAGTASGKKKYTGECYLTDYSESSPNNGKVSFSASLQISGAVTAGTN